jgi:hypothetical protein
MGTMMTFYKAINLDGIVKSQKAGSCRKRQPMSTEVEPNLTLFFRPFLNTWEGMDADLGFSVNS